ncbi:hypothetical protein PVBG_00541 [Plasmodium vivax Brazil I]|uniref:Uncharacterized protein n=1 Tax=Plasmodium vivax (strain Brazil I) TaxID=1033975 RepID=A0A0J9SPN3_PLAV1|nr:hypothetical protein PVBG_00541 [Plasmodium vivax Brazil I]
MNETFFSQNENELTSEYHIPEKEVDAPPAKDAQALQHVVSKGENGEGEKGEGENEENENDGEIRGDENCGNENRGNENRNDQNRDEEKYNILNMLNEIKEDLLLENEKLQQQSSQKVHIAEGEDGDKPDRNAANHAVKQTSNQDNHAIETKNANNDNGVALENGQCGEEVRVPNSNDKTGENPKKLPKEEPQVEEEPLEKQLNPSDAQVNSPDAAPNEQSQKNVGSKKGSGRPYKNTKNIPSDAKSTPFLSKETPKKRKAKNGPNPEYAALAMHSMHPAHSANLAKVTKTNNPLIDEEIEYLTNCEFVTHNYLKGIAKKNPRVKSDNVNIDIFYSSRSEKSMDESEGEEDAGAEAGAGAEAEAEADSSVDSIEEFYENICQSDAPLDFYKNSLSAKQEVKEVQPEYFFNTENSATEEIQILNRYIKDMTEGQQKNSSPIDVDNKLVNILSLSFLTFIDHVIYDSHIYALKSEFTPGGEADKGKKSTTDGISTPNGNPQNGNSQNECLDGEAVRERTENINIVGGNAPNGTNLQNDPDKDNTEMCPPKEKSFSMNDTQDGQRKEPPRAVDQLDNPEKGAKQEAAQNGGVNTPERGDQVGTEIIYTPDVINLCLTNLYNQELVSKIMNQKMSEGDTSGAGTDNVKESAPNTSKLIHNHTTAATAQPGKTEKTHSKESANEMNSKSGGLLKSKDSLQTNINHKLNKRQIIINKINEKIKKKSINSLQSCANTKKYSLDDLFEL